MNILMLTTKFCHLDGSSWLPSELTDELIKKGHKVQVLNLEWSGEEIHPNIKNKDINFFEFRNFKSLRFNFGKFSVPIRWFFSSFKILPFLLKKFLIGERYDLMIGFSPCTSLYAALPLARFLSRDAILIYWDFFPVHNQEISKKIPRKILPFIKSVEKKLINLYSRIGCMSQANIIFFEKYFGKNYAQKVFLLPIWTSILEMPDFHEKQAGLNFFDNPNAIIFVFGGQLVEGRGVVEFCEAILQAKKKNSNISLVVCGDGFLSREVLSFQGKYPTAIKYLGALPRSEYLKVLSLSDVGVVSTVANVSAPTFPSKSLDYMASSLPILAAVEEASDFGKVVEENNFGYACKADDKESLVDGIIKITKSKESIKTMGKNGNSYLRKYHSVENAAKLITGVENV